MKAVEDLEQLGRMRLILQHYLDEVRLLAPESKAVQDALEIAIDGLEAIAETRLNQIREAEEARLAGTDHLIASQPSSGASEHC